jgi:hypothetical protein
MINVMKSAVFLDVTLYNLVDCCCLLVGCLVLLFNPEVGGSTFLENIGELLTEHAIISVA